MIVLDTHAWVWWLGDPSLLSRPAREAIDAAAARSELYVSAISVWEVALLVARGRLELTMDLDDWVRRAEALPFITYVPVDNAVALRSVRLGEAFPEDPADRMIVATATGLGAPLVTKDRRLRKRPEIETIW